MCWFIDIEITKRAEVKKYDQSFIHELSNDYQFVGEFPRYQIIRNQCLCDFFVPEFDRTSLMRVLEQIAVNWQSKRIQVLKYWSKPSTSTSVKKIGMAEFRKLLNNNDLEEKVWYQIMDETKFHFD